MGLLKFFKNLFGEEIMEQQKELVKTPISTRRRVGGLRNGKMTKTELVRRHLLDKQSITSWEAIELYGATRLSAIIFDLREAGYDIKTVPTKTTDRNDNTCIFATYTFYNEN